MKRLLVAALLAGGLAATTVPATAAPWCGTLTGVNCWTGSEICVVWVGPTHTCVERPRP